MRSSHRVKRLALELLVVAFSKVPIAAFQARTRIFELKNPSPVVPASSGLSLTGALFNHSINWIKYMDQAIESANEVDLPI